MRTMTDSGALYSRADWAKAIGAAALENESVWRGELEAGAGPHGRGSTARVVLTGGPSLVLKRLARGGALARFRPEGFHGTRRLLANLWSPDELLRRGVATPRSAALLLVRSGVSRFRGFLAVEEIEGATDLRRRWAENEAALDELDAALATVRGMHDAGFLHRDLNLGNLLVRGSPTESFVIDLDGGRWHRGPLGSGARAASLRRLERSYVKLFGSRGPLGPRGRELFWERYAPGDLVTRRRVLRRRWTGRMAVAWHRMGWSVAGGGMKERPE